MQERRFSTNVFKCSAPSLRRLLTIRRVLIFFIVSVFIRFLNLRQLLPFSREHVHRYNDYANPSRIIWSREELLHCMRTRCLRSKDFITFKISKVDAISAFEYMQNYLSAKPPQPPPRPKGFLRRASESKCAVIGGAPLPTDIDIREQSKMVDETSSLVIRLNQRLPSLVSFETQGTLLGSRTDAVVLQRISLQYYESFLSKWRMSNSTAGRLRKEAGKKVLQEGTQFFLRTRCVASREACPDSWIRLTQSSLLNSSSVHMLRPELEILSIRALQEIRHKNERRNSMPSTGLVAILMAIRMCKHVNLFGFGGNTEGDGDFGNRNVWPGHELTSERRLVRKLEHCKGWYAGAECGKITVYS